MATHPNPRDVLILGGGEGATLREALKHGTVKRAVMVDIDRDVVELSRAYLPQMHQGAFDDPRAKVVIQDGFVYVEEAIKAGDKYDVIIMDLTDPYSSDIAKQLYTREFFAKIRRILNDDGVVVTQAGNSFYFPAEYDMRVLQFAWDGNPANLHKPHNHVKNSLVYTGTHDNNTAVGWFTEEATPAVRREVLKYGNCRPREINWCLIRLAHMSTSASIC